MKTILIAAIVAITLSNPSPAQDKQNAEEPGGSILEVDKRYLFMLAETSRLKDFPGLARVLTPIKDGWVRIEYQPGAPGLGTTLPTKSQVWLNLTHVVTIQNVQGKGAK